MEPSLPHSGVIGVTVGAVVLVGLICLIPIYLAWYHRRRVREQQRTVDTRPSSAHGPVSMEELAQERRLCHPTPKPADLYKDNTWWVRPVFFGQIRGFRQRRGTGLTLMLSAPDPCANSMLPLVSVICLSTLARRSSQDSQLPVPEPVRIAASGPPHYLYPQNYDYYVNSRSNRTKQPDASQQANERQELPAINEIWVLSCEHAFHAPCLASWFRQGRYICPTCKTLYFVIPR